VSICAHQACHQSSREVFATGLLSVLLRCDLVGGLLLVTQQFVADGTFTLPYITVVAAPALAFLGSFLATDPPGFAYSDFWDKSNLSPYAFAVDDNDHCPLLVAAIRLFPSGQASFEQLAAGMLQNTSNMNGGMWQSTFVAELSFSFVSCTSFAYLY
jgi:hypothetical protein